MEFNASMMNSLWWTNKRSF